MVCQRDGGVEEGGDFLGEEEDGAAFAVGEVGEFEGPGGFLSLGADVDGGEALAAELGGDVFIGVAGDDAGAELAAGGRCRGVARGKGRRRAWAESGDGDKTLRGGNLAGGERCGWGW